jgi:PBP1b-binding outer membrane lipoprotein LpoB
MKANKTMRAQAVPNHSRRKDKDSESNIDSAAHNQTLKQQKKLNDRNHHIHININTECQRTQLSHQKTPFGKLN